MIRPGLLETIEMAGAGLIIGTETLGLVVKGSFSANWLPLAPVGRSSPAEWRSCSASAS